MSPDKHRMKMGWVSIAKWARLSDSSSQTGSDGCTSSAPAACTAISTLASNRSMPLFFFHVCRLVIYRRERDLTDRARRTTVAVTCLEYSHLSSSKVIRRFDVSVTLVISKYYPTPCMGRWRSWKARLSNWVNSWADRRSSVRTWVDA